jgi:hypothetical protein
MARRLAKHLTTAKPVDVVNEAGIHVPNVNE